MSFSKTLYHLLITGSKIPFVDYFLLFQFRVCHVFLSVHCSLVVTCWERANPLALMCEVFIPPSLKKL